MQTKQKVLFLITKATWGGAQKYVFDLATHLPPERFTITLAFGQPGRLSDTLSAQSVVTHRISALGRDVAVISDILSFFQILKYLKSERPDVLHLNSSKAAALGALAGRIAGIKNIVFTAHGWPFKEDRGFLATWLIYLLSWKTVLLAHQTIVVSKVDEQIGNRMWWCAGKIARVPLGREPVQFLQPEEAFRAMFGTVPPPLITGSTLRLASIAELTANKGISYAIDAVEHLTHRGTDVIYVVASDGEDKEYLQKYVREKGVSDRIFFPGFVTEAARNLRGFDAYLSPSIKEGLPYVLIEAAQAGIPVIATDIVREDFSSFPQFTFVPVRDGLALADAIEHVAKKSRGQTAIDPFPLSDMIDHTMALYSR
jgi:glycosyltransferase involved in cell wall biosynthesis